MNPEDLAAERHKEIRQARERVAETERAQGKSSTRVAELRAELGGAEYRERQALGAALVDGKAAPPSEAVKLKAELAQEEQNLDARTQAVQDAHGQIGRLVRDNRETWRGQTLLELGKAKSRYKEAIAELEAAREGLGNVATLLNWLSSGDISEAATDALGGRRGSDPAGRPVLAFTFTLEELRHDCEHLADAHLATRDERIPEPQWHLAHGPGARGMRLPGWGGSR